MDLRSPHFHPAPAWIPSRPEDLDLLRRSAQDDAAAFDALFERHRDGLQGFLFRKLRSHEEAEDAVILTFSNAWRARGSFRGTASGKAWLYQIATRVALDIMRRRRRRAPEQELDALAPDALDLCGEVVDPEDTLLDAARTEWMRGTVEQAMEQLEPEERRLLRLFYFEDYSYEQISDLLGVTRSQIRGRLHRIRGRVRRDLVKLDSWQAC